MEIRFRKAEIKDLDRIEEMYRKVVQGMQGKGIDQWDETYPNREVLKEDIRKKELYIGRIGDDICSAFVFNQEVDEQYRNGAWNYPKAQFYTFHRFCVNPKLQNLGIGKKTLLHIEKLVIGMGAETIRMDTFSGNPYALGLYQKMGYKITGEAHWRKGKFYLLEKKLKMCRTLTSSTFLLEYKFIR